MNLVTGDVYGSYSVSSGVSRVHKDTQLSATGDLYLMAGSQVMCDFYNPFVIKMCFIFLCRFLGAMQFAQPLLSNLSANIYSK